MRQIIAEIIVTGFEGFSEILCGDWLLPLKSIDFL